MNLAIDKSIVSIASQPRLQSHLGWLDQIRGAAALYVVCHHAVMQITVAGDHAHDPLYRILQLLTSYGHYAVDIFIVLSGYCLMLPVVAKQKFGNIWTFYLRRTVRIVLPYYAAIGVTLLLIHLWMGESQSTWAEHSLPVTVDSIWKHLLLIHQWFPDAALKINGAFWSVGVEYQIYFLFPLFYFLAKTFGFIKSLIGITLTSYALWGVSYYSDSFNPGPNGTSIYYCALFFMGMLAAQYATDGKDEFRVKCLSFVDQYPREIMILAYVGIVGVAATDFLVSHYLHALFFPLQAQSLFIGLFVAVLLYLKGKTKSSKAGGGGKVHFSCTSSNGWGPLVFQCTCYTIL